MFHEPTCGCQSTFTLTDSVPTASLCPMLSDFIAALEQRLRLVEIISGFDRYIKVSGTLMTNTTDVSSETVFKAPLCLDLLSHRSAGVASLWVYLNAGEIPYSPEREIIVQPLYLHIRLRD